MMQYLIESRIEELRERLNRINKPGASFGENLKLLEERNSIIFTIKELEFLLQKAKDKNLVE